MKNCRVCDSVLVLGTNWIASYQKCYNYTCQSCDKIKKAKYRAANRTSILQSKEQYRKKNKAYIDAYQKEYQKTNKAKRTELANRRRLRKKNQLDPSANQEAIDQLYALAAFLSRVTGRRYTVDHIKPVAKGGTNHESNLIVMRGDLNSSKGPNEWPWLYKLKQF